MRLEQSVMLQRSQVGRNGRRGPQAKNSAQITDGWRTPMLVRVVLDGAQDLHLPIPHLGSGTLSAGQESHGLLLLAQQQHGILDFRSPSRAA